MKKRLITFLMLSIIIVGHSGLVCHGLESREEIERHDAIYDKSGVSGLYDILDEETKELMDSADIDPANVETDKLGHNLLSVISKLISDKLSAPMRSLAAIIAVVIICRIFNVLGGSNSSDISTAVGTLTVTATAMPTLIGLISTIQAIVSTASIFVLTCVPVYVSLLLAVGNPKTAISYSSLALAVGNIIPLISNAVILPLINILLAFTVLSAVSSTRFSAISSSIYSFIKWLLVLLVTVFFALVVTQTALSKSFDEATAKTAKLVVSSTIPVVGGAMGDALSAIQGSIEIVKSGAAALGILASILIFLPLIIELLLWIIICWISEIAAELFEVSSVSAMMKSISAIIKMMLAIILSIAAVCLICSSIVILARG